MKPGINQKFGFLNLGLLGLDNRLRLGLISGRNRLGLLEKLSLHLLLVLDGLGVSSSLRALTGLNNGLLDFGRNLGGHLGCLVDGSSRLDLLEKLGLDQLLLLNSLGVGSSLRALASLSDRVLDLDRNLRGDLLGLLLWLLHDRVVNTSDRLDLFKELGLHFLLVLNSSSVSSSFGCLASLDERLLNLDGNLGGNFLSDLFLILGSQSLLGSNGELLLDGVRESGKAGIGCVLGLLSANTSGSYRGGGCLRNSALEFFLNHSLLLNLCRIRASLSDSTSLLLAFPHNLGDESTVGFEGNRGGEASGGGSRSHRVQGNIGTNNGQTRLRDGVGKHRRHVSLDTRKGVALLVRLLVELDVFVSTLGGDRLRDLLASLELDGVSCTLGSRQRVDAENLVELVRRCDRKAARDVRWGLERKLLVVARLPDS
ncbi:hypothetical protein HG530_006256 [Fusarium avenaceum]|nr:hypothetical protein HG530_006256 [Fusarium avenaceum]